MDEASAAISHFYECWSYPPPIGDLAGTKPLLADPCVSGLRYWPRRRDFSDLDILSAGCGTFQAASIAYHNPSSRVIGIDVSEASLSHQQQLKEKHGLDNLRLRKLDLRESAKLGERFDLILATGVLHHLAEPSAGLSALRQVLRPTAAMDIMVYSRAERLGIYPLQEALRALGVQATPEGIAMMRAIVDRLPADHPAQSVLRKFSAEMLHDAALADLLLNPVDRAYTIPEMLDWLERNEIRFVGWLDPLRHSPTAQLAGHPALESILALPRETQWRVLEQLVSPVGGLRFVACRKDRPEADHRVDLNGPAFPDYVPSWAPDTEVVDGSPIILRRAGASMPINAAAQPLFELIDGKHTIHDILTIANVQPGTLFERLYEWGYLLFRIP